jgi:hypothetical protein
VVTDPRQVMTVFNSQATAFIRELAPCMLLPTVQWQRYDDIFASLIAQRVMRERGLHVHFGKPFVWQQRNPHDDLRDLRAEIDGMEHILDLAQRLDRLTFGPSETSFQMARAIWDDTELSELGETWVTDCEKAMA